MDPTRRAIAAIVSTLTVSLCAVLVGPAARAAEPIQPIDPFVSTVCEPGTWYTVNVTSKTPTVTHAARYENIADGTLTTTLTAAWKTTLKSAVTATVSGTYTASAVIAKLSVTAGISLSAENTQTSSGSEQVTATIPPHKIAVLAKGRVAVAGNWSATYCSSAGQIINNSSGGVTSFDTLDTTAVMQCDLTAPAGSLAAAAKVYC